MNKNMTCSHIHLDVVGGIAGDMFVASMLDMSPHLKTIVLDAIRIVLPATAGTCELVEGINSGISGLRFKLQSPKANEEKHEAEHSHSHSHQHTTYRHLCQLITSSSLHQSVSKVAVELLTIIAKAEAKIHAKTLDDVHFHELADWDSLMDVVASAVILNKFKGCTWSHSPLPVGGGLVKTQHGLIPVPAPATTEILTGFNFIDDGIQGERITPTGAAILKYLANNDLLSERKAGILNTTGYGLGTKNFTGMPNILRATLFKLNAEPKAQQSTVVIIEFDIDDMTGEELGLSIDLIRHYKGVLDVVCQSAKGKKNRPVELIRILASTDHYQDVMSYCFEQTTTIGLRYRFETRVCLEREHLEMDGLAYKQVTRPNNRLTIKIEHDHLKELSTLHSRRMQKYKLESPE